jgi:hypothetical protein
MIKRWESVRVKKGDLSPLYTISEQIYLLAD